MNNELIERIDFLQKYYPRDAIGDLLRDCKAALTQQQEAEPVAWILTGTDRDLVPRRYLLFGGREADLHVSQNLAGGEWQSCAAKPLFLHPPKPAAQPVAGREEVETTLYNYLDEELRSFAPEIEWGGYTVNLASVVADIALQAAQPQVPEGKGRDYCPMCDSFNCRCSGC